MEVRPFASSDEAKVARLWRTVFPESSAWNVPEHDIRRKQSVQSDMFLVAVDGAALLGTAMAGWDGHRGWVYYVVVDPGARRRGIGTALMQRVEEALGRVGCPKLNLQVRAGNEQVIAFYEKLGYEIENRVSFGKRLGAADV